MIVMKHDTNLERDCYKKENEWTQVKNTQFFIYDLDER